MLNVRKKIMRATGRDFYMQGHTLADLIAHMDTRKATAQDKRTATEAYKAAQDDEA